MQIDSILGTQQAYYAENTISGKKNNDNEKNFPLSWQPDNVSISDEARAAYATLKQEKEQAGEEPNADEEFSEYMKDARGESPASADPVKQLEELEKMLEKLQAKLADVAQSGLPEEAKRAQMGALQSEISAITAQIGELMKSTQA